MRETDPNTITIMHDSNVDTGKVMALASVLAVTYCEFGDDHEDHDERVWETEAGLFIDMRIESE